MMSSRRSARRRFQNIDQDAQREAAVGEIVELEDPARKARAVEKYRTCDVDRNMRSAGSRAL
jgi:hypothetical protein